METGQHSVLLPRHNLPMSRLFLGVDGGQTTTTAVISDETGRLVGDGKAGPCNHVRGEGGRKKFVAAIRACISAACEPAGLDPETVEFEGACLGFSGGPADKAPILAGMLRAAKLVVTHDALIALAGATAGMPGVITIAGTGSIAFGRNATGKTARAGGWGYKFGDEGGAFDLTRQALRAALRYEEGWGPPTTLHRALTRTNSAATANDLMHRFYARGYPRWRIADNACLVDEEAREGDAVARQILHEAARQLAAITAAVRQQLFQPSEPARVCYVGGVFNSTILLEHYRTLVESEAGNQCTEPLHSPVTGALFEAYRAAGVTPVLDTRPD